MKIRYLFLLLISVSTIVIFISLWILVSDGYDKQNKLILTLKKIIPRTYCSETLIYYTRAQNSK